MLCVLHAIPGFALDVPPSLQPWENWVLHGKQERTCPSHFDDGTRSHCWWPSRLIVNASDTGGLFEQQVMVYAPSWVTLPGGRHDWPETVSGPSGMLSVVDRNGRPSVWLMPGEHRIDGAFVWDDLPDVLPIPPEVGLVSLRINNGEIATIDPGKNGQLRLHGSGGRDTQQDRVSVHLFRCIEDDIPMRVVTHALLQVSGRPREIRLASLLPENSFVMDIDSPLPAQMSDDNELLIQARPGSWDVRVTARMPGNTTSLSIANDHYGPEIWSFKAYNHLRMVKVTGAPTIEPSRTQMPDDWKDLPAYRVQPGEGLSFDVIRRGDTDPAPDQLQLERTWWLDFDGRAFTLHDRLSGSLNRTWHLAMKAPVELGRIVVDGQDRLITRQNKLPGVQLRRGRLAMQADSRLARQSSILPAVGWDHDFQRISGTLNLPPGWTLLSTAGVDVPPDAWLQRWTLLDLFLVLIIAISAWKLRSPLVGLLVLVTLVLIFHEPGAPRHVWLHLLIVAALLRYLPDGWFRKVIRLWGVGAVIALLAISLPFMVQQIRTAVYPQLKAAYASTGGLWFTPATEGIMSDAAMPPPVAKKSLASVRTMNRSAIDKAQPLVMKQAAQPGLDSRYQLEEKDPDALIQTGPGLPTWRWHRVPLRWNGPVDRDHRIRLWLISPFMNLILGLIRVMLLFVLIGIVVDIKRWRRYLSAPVAEVTVAFLISAGLLMSPPVSLAESGRHPFPPQALLDELQQRLLEPPACLPNCADISRLELAAMPDQLRLIMQVHALADTAIPLPVLRGAWSPADVMIDCKPVSSLLRDGKGMLWTVVPEGVHQLKLTGPAGKADEIRLAIPMRPHKITYAGVGWQAQGIHADGSIDSGIVLTRVKNGAVKHHRPSGSDIEPFFHLSRTLHLGIRWEVTTRIRRQTDPGTPVVLSVPLLAGESVTTPGVHTEAGQAQITMGPNAVETHFTSTLALTEAIQLKAPAGVPWTETWTLDASPIWRCETSGLTVIHHQDAGHTWKPQWRPWPGETVSIRVSRPEAVPGRTMTVDHVHLEVTPGSRFSRSGLEMGIRTSNGGQHQIELPPMANLQTVTINGQSLPIHQDGRLVNIPLEPGSRQVRIQWQQLTESLTRISAPVVGIGHAAVNATVSFRMPDQRWILFVGGPSMGPAVLFWSYVAVAVLISLGLGRTHVTPLGTRQWLLLTLGLTQIPAPVAILVVGWLMALGFRCRKTMPRGALSFNLVQLTLAALTLAALAGLYTAIERGLLGIPDMQIAGNHSSHLQLNWTQDRIDTTLPTPWVISLPMWTYRLIMLSWSLWMAFSLVSWLRWGWTCFSKERLWKSIRIRRKTKPATGEDASAFTKQPY
ncbi:MAG: hypothetical protein CSA23_04625 [Deltaproteobacteria bacterium]|nr:MAG: hypothetical protein CSA23_04625 [Deltaproteobacteria bacterium]